MSFRPVHCSNTSQMWRGKETPILYSSEHSRGGLGCLKSVTVLWCVNSLLKGFAPNMWGLCLGPVNTQLNFKKLRVGELLSEYASKQWIHWRQVIEPNESMTLSWANVLRQGSFSSWLQELLSQHLLAHSHCEPIACITQCFLLNKGRVKMVRVWT